MFTIPNLLTLLRLFLVPCFLWASVERMYGVALILFVTAALTDVADGMLARRLNQRSRLGALLDPAADKLLMVSGYLFYTLSTTLPVVRIPGWLTFTVFIRDFLIALVAYLLYTRVHVKRFPPSWAGKTSTVLQAVALGMAVAVNAFIPSLVWLAQLFFRLALAVTLYSSFDYLRRGERLLEGGASARA
ncbi:MAG TPA: CDP-alcohol phosphatidyltransferase family protein [Thermoanaerobaculia bacterium]|nr:CDP-alcohol phosphatidyltransferase family protein [Thermoanaerobaculia bacterium]